MRPFQAVRRIVRFQAGHVRTIRAAFLASCRSLSLLVIRRRGMGIQVMANAFKLRLPFFAQETDRVLFDCGQSPPHKTIDHPVGWRVVGELIMTTHSGCSSACSISRSKASWFLLANSMWSSSLAMIHQEKPIVEEGTQRFP